MWVVTVWTPLVFDDHVDMNQTGVGFQSDGIASRTGDNTVTASDGGLHHGLGDGLGQATAHEDVAFLGIIPQSLTRMSPPLPGRIQNTDLYAADAGFSQNRQADVNLLSRREADHRAGKRFHPNRHEFLRNQWLISNFLPLGDGFSNPRRNRPSNHCEKYFKVTIN